ncbi:MAG: exodeoxyribonuclease VII small subunit [Oscillospiraceae bacterium]|jgi:exodeoxyribonuclease VII small subunit|nr:exodeoxyribonuclease VII small subunit [Oscillospiraceae bacterium]
MKFEDNLKELENVLKQLEKGELPLEDAVKLYTDGMKLAVLCRKDLDEAKLQISEM